MVKAETVGMWEVAKSNPVIKLNTDTKNYAFINFEDNDYVVMNVINGDDSYLDDVTIKAGEPLNGMLLKAWEGQNLIVDGKHITNGVKDLEKDNVLVIGSDGMLKAGSASGVHFVVKDKVTLTEAAVKVEIRVASATATTAPGN